MQKTLTIKPNNHPNEFTDDFNSLLNILVWISWGFVFSDYILLFATTNIFHANAFELGLMYSLVTIGQMISMLIVGFFVDRKSKFNFKKFFMIIGTAGRSVAYMIMYLGIIWGSLNIFLIGNFLLGNLTGFFWTPYNATIAQKSNKNARSFAYGKKNLKMGIGEVGGLLIGVLIYYLGIRFTPSSFAIIYGSLVAFTIANLYGLIIFFRKINLNDNFEKGTKPSLTPGLIPSLESNVIPSLKPAVLMKKSSKRTHEHSHNHLHIHSQNHIISKMLKKPISGMAYEKRKKLALILGTIILLFTYFIDNIHYSLVKPFIRLYIVQNIINNPVIIIFVYIPSVIFSTFLSPRIGKLNDRINPRLFLTIAGVTNALMTLSLIYIQNMWLFMSLLTISTIMEITSLLILDTFVSKITKKYRGAMMSIVGVIVSFGGAVGPLIGGYYYDSSGATTPFLISIYMIFGIIVLYVIAITLIKPYIDEK